MMLSKSEGPAKGKKKKVPILGWANLHEEERIREAIEKDPIQYLKEYIWRCEHFPQDPYNWEDYKERFSYLTEPKRLEEYIEQRGIYFHDLDNLISIAKEYGVDIQIVEKAVCDYVDNKEKAPSDAPTS